MSGQALTQTITQAITEGATQVKRWSAGSALSAVVALAATFVSTLHGGPQLLLLTVSGVRPMAEVLPDAFGPESLEAVARAADHDA